MAIVSLNISQLNIARLLQQANNTLTAMTGNPDFPTPSPSLADIGALIGLLSGANNEYELLLVAEKEKLTLRNDAAQAVVDGLTALGGYVQTASRGDPAKIQSAGLNVRAARIPATVPEVVAGLAVAPGDEAGTLDLSWGAMPAAVLFEVQTSVDPVSGIWTNHPSVTKSSTSVSGFSSGAKIYSRVRAINAAGTGAWSNEVGKIVP
jgi:hypothetical protein